MKYEDPKTLAALERAAVHISRHRIASIIDVKNWKNFGVLAQVPKPAAHDATPEEDELIRQVWLTMPGYTSWMDAARDLYRYHRHHLYLELSDLTKCDDDCPICQHKRGNPEMDPTAAFEMLVQSLCDGDTAAAKGFAENLEDWMDKGGFAPEIRSVWLRNLIEFCIAEF